MCKAMQQLAVTCTLKTKDAKIVSVFTYTTTAYGYLYATDYQSADELNIPKQYIT